MTTTTKDITAAEWLDVRDRVSKEVTAANPRSTTATSIAERLLRNGLIDIEAVLVLVRPKPEAKAAPVPRSERVSPPAPVVDEGAFK